MTLMTIAGSTPTQVVTLTTAEKQSFFLAARARSWRADFRQNNQFQQFLQRFICTK